MISQSGHVTHYAKVITPTSNMSIQLSDMIDNYNIYRRTVAIYRDEGRTTTLFFFIKIYTTFLFFLKGSNLCSVWESDEHRETRLLYWPITSLDHITLYYVQYPHLALLGRGYLTGGSCGPLANDCKVALTHTPPTDSHSHVASAYIISNAYDSR